jgi:four helix bundle protein
MATGLEDLKIYKLARRLEIFIHKVTEKFPTDEKFRSVDQLRRASSSVTDNIAESYNRFSYGDKINRMYIARGEAGETNSGIIKAHKKGFISEKINIFCEEKYTELMKGINGYISFLKKKQNNLGS